MAHRLDNLKAQRALSAMPTVGLLSKQANVSDAVIHRMENGEAIEPHIAQRIADAMGVSLATLGKKDI